MGNQFITGRNLFAMSIRCARAYEKVIAFSKDKCDVETLEPKKRGETMQIVSSMLVKMHNDTKKTFTSDDESESEETPSTTNTELATIAEGVVAGEPAGNKSGQKSNDNDEIDKKSVVQPK